MKTTIDLPDDLVKEVTVRAAQEGIELPDAVARLIRKGLATESAAPVTADEEMLRLRKEIADKFISGEWGVEFDGYEAGIAAELESAREMEDRWRK